MNPASSSSQQCAILPNGEMVVPGDMVVVQKPVIADEDIFTYGVVELRYFRHSTNDALVIAECIHYSSQFNWFYFIDMKRDHRELTKFNRTGIFMVFPIGPVEGNMEENVEGNVEGNGTTEVSPSEGDINYGKTNEVNILNDENMEDNSKAIAWLAQWGILRKPGLTYAQKLRLIKKYNL